MRMLSDDGVEYLREFGVLLEGIGRWRNFGRGPQCERQCWGFGLKQCEQLRGRILRIWHYVYMRVIWEGSQSSKESHRTDLAFSTLLQCRSS